ncbi:hypothetical protein D3C80_1871190 [compost metagenome]
MLIKYKLLEWQQVDQAALQDWVAGASCLVQLHTRHFAQTDPDAWLQTMVDELVAAGAARREGRLLHNV